MHVVAMIMAGGEGSRLTVLSEKRAKPSVPFAGKYRIIDFTLSNCINSRLYDVAILTQYRPHSLNDHIGIGKPWDLDRAHGGVRLLQPYQARGSQGWYQGTADAIYQNLDYLFNRDADLAIILSGDHIYKMDYRAMIAYHEDKGADLTVAVMNVPLEETDRFGIMTTNKQGRVTEFHEKPQKRDKGTLASMGIYVFNVEKLAERLQAGHGRYPNLDFGKHVIPDMITSDKVYAFLYDGYWVDVGTIDAYWKTSLELCDPGSPLNLWDSSWIIRTRSQERPPVKCSAQGVILRSLVSNGCTVHGRVEHSVLSPGVYVSPGAVVRDSVVMNDAWIGPGAIVDSAVIDKQAVVGPGVLLGYGDDMTPNHLLPDKLDTGITVVGKGAHIPANARIGRNVLIESDVDEAHFASFSGYVVPSGSTIAPAAVPDAATEEVSVMNVLAMILAGGASPALSVLSASRAEPAVPFGGKYRIIDFPLSNCVNSGIYNVAVLTQYMPRSLNEHIRSGKPWDLDRDAGGVRLLQPYLRLPHEDGAWQEGSADAVRLNLDVVRESKADDVLILAGNHIYKMNYELMIEFHRMRKADITIAVRAVSPHQTYRFGMATTDSDGRITRFEEKPRRTRADLASMGVYVFKSDVLLDLLGSSSLNHRHLGAEVIPAQVRRKRIFAYTFEGYWANTSTVPTYYEANMALLADSPALDLSDPRWVIHTVSEQRPPVWFGPEAKVDGNLLCDGARVEGRVLRSIIGPGVYIGPGAEVSDSILMNDVHVESGAVVHRAILDKEVRIGENAIIGCGEDNTPNSSLPEVLNTGVTLVGKRSQLPPGIIVGRNVAISPNLSVDRFPDPEIPSGMSL